MGKVESKLISKSLISFLGIVCDTPSGDHSTQGLVSKAVINAPVSLPEVLAGSGGESGWVEGPAAAEVD